MIILCMLKTDQLLVSHEEVLTSKCISSVKSLILVQMLSVMEP